ncbi:hypothetical protein BH683_024020 [Williamsia sp. 1138]|nr:hypothetical protein BH683_024020 [Williamsia sp. 1138]
MTCSASSALEAEHFHTTGASCGPIGSLQPFDRTKDDPLTTTIAPEATARRRTLPRGTDPAIIGVVAFVVSVIGAGRPSFWFDEAATIAASTRSTRELFELVSQHDSAHSLYYLLMHGWFSIFPSTEFWARVPSLLAVGVGAAGVVVLGKKLSSRAVGITAGLFFAALPRVTWAAIEARPYALAAAVAVWATVALLVAVERRKVGFWALYAVGVMLAILVNIHLLLMVCVYLCVIGIIRAPRPVVLSWALATGAALAVLLPYIQFMRSKADQINWIRPLDKRVLFTVVQGQYFETAVWAVGCAVAVIAGVIVVLLLRKPAITGFWRTVAVAAAWIIVPTAGMLLYSVFVKVIYVDRYLTFTAPAMALLLGVCTVQVAARSLVRIEVVLIVFAVAVLPNYVHQRGDYAKFGADYSQVADTIAAQSSPGDCFLLDETVRWRPRPIRALPASRPEAFENLVDVGLREPATVPNFLWDRSLPPDRVVDRIADCDVLWTIAGKNPAVPDHERGSALDPGAQFAASPAFGVPSALGFRIVERWQFNYSQLNKSVR